MPKKQLPDIFQTLRKDAFEALEEASDFESVKKVEADYLGKNGRLTRVLRSLKELPVPERKTMGSTANALKKEIEEKIRTKKAEFETKDSARVKEKWIDVSSPGKKKSKGHFHPLSRVLREVSSIFESMGFETIEGPEAETERYNFDALNIPKNHPARDMWNTFWLKEPKSQISNLLPSGDLPQGDKSQTNPKQIPNSKFLLRTHTSPNQMRYMESHQPPFRIIVPGRCFRYEATDATHEIQFYQVEGLMIGEKINLANLKGIMEVFFQRFFKDKNLEARFRPSYFPFVEPGVEVDVRLSQISNLKSQNSDWLEVAGAGMVHPNVIKNAKLDPNQWQGFAFGLGLDRLAMLKYKIDDIRLFYSGDLRFINQF